ncbi:MAG: GNAT family N-acetyltransferase [Acidimicrobiia bacterium]
MVPADYDEIYRWTADPRTSGLWRYRGGTPPPDTVIRQLWDGVTAQYCVTRPPDQRPLGLVGLYNSNHVSQYCYLFALSAPEVLRTGLVLRGALQLIDYAFARFRLRKIYLETLESSFSAFRSASLIGAISEEGRLREHEWNGTTYDDLVFLSIDRDQWARFRQRFGGEL